MTIADAADGWVLNGDSGDMMGGDQVGGIGGEELQGQHPAIVGESEWLLPQLLAS